MAVGSAPGTMEKSKKAKKRRRESDPGGGAVPGDAGAPSKPGSDRRKSTSSREVVLRCAPGDAMSPVLVSFANQTVPQDMGALKFAVHEGEEEGREGHKVVMGEGPR